jgi:hypothetical protein
VHVAEGFDEGVAIDGAGWCGGHGKCLKRCWILDGQSGNAGDPASPSPAQAGRDKYVPG